MSSLAMAAASSRGGGGGGGANNNRRRRRPQYTSSSPLTSSSNNNKTPCIYYNRGYCSRGSSCRFAHTSSSTSFDNDDNIDDDDEEEKDIPSFSPPPTRSSIKVDPSPSANKICSFYKKGYCSRGTSCHFLHADTPPPPPPPPPPEIPRQDRSIQAIRARVSKCREAVVQAENSLRRSSSYREENEKKQEEIYSNILYDATEEEEEENEHEQQQWERKLERKASGQYDKFIVEEGEKNTENKMVVSNVENDISHVMSPLPPPQSKEKKPPPPPPKTPPRPRQSSLQAALSNIHTNKYNTPPTEIRIQQQQEKQIQHNYGGGSSISSRMEDSISLLSYPPSPVVDNTAAVKKLFEESYNDDQKLEKKNKHENNQNDDEEDSTTDIQLSEVQKTIDNTLALLSAPPLGSTKSLEKKKETLKEVQKNVDDALMMLNAPRLVPTTLSESKDALNNIQDDDDEGVKKGEKETKLTAAAVADGDAKVENEEVSSTTIAAAADDGDANIEKEDEEKVNSTKSAAAASDNNVFNEEKKDGGMKIEPAKELLSTPVVTTTAATVTTKVADKSQLVAASPSQSLPQIKDDEGSKSGGDLEENKNDIVLTTKSEIVPLLPAASTIMMKNDDKNDKNDKKEECSLIKIEKTESAAVPTEMKPNEEYAAPQNSKNTPKDDVDHFSKKIQKVDNDNISSSFVKLDDTEKNALPTAPITQSKNDDEEQKVHIPTLKAKDDTSAATTNKKEENTSMLRSSTASATNDNKQKEEEKEERFASFLVEPLSPCSAPQNNYSTPTRKKRGECFFISASFDEKDLNRADKSDNVSAISSPCSEPLPSLEKRNQKVEKKKKPCAASTALEGNSNNFSTPTRRKQKEHFPTFVPESPASLQEMGNKYGAVSPFSSSCSLPLPSFENSNEKKPKDEERFSSFVSMSSFAVGAKKASMPPRSPKKKSPIKKRQTVGGTEGSLEKEKTTPSSVSSAQSPTSSVKTKTVAKPLKEKQTAVREYISNEKKIESSSTSPSSLLNPKRETKQSPPSQQQQQQKSEKDDGSTKKEPEKVSKPLPTSVKTPSSSNGGKVSSLAAAAASGKFQNRARFLDSVPETPPSLAQRALLPSKHVAHAKPAAKSPAAGMSSLAAASAAGRQKNRTSSQNSQYTTKSTSPSAHQTAVRIRTVTPKSVPKASNATEKESGVGMSSLAAAAATGRNKSVRRQQNNRHPRSQQRTSATSTYVPRNAEGQHYVARKRASDSGSSLASSVRDTMSPDGAVHHHQQYNHKYHTPQTPPSLTSSSKGTPVWERLYHSKDETTSTPDLGKNKFSSPVASTVRRSSGEHQHRHHYRDQHQQHPPQYSHHDYNHANDIDECTFEPDIHRSQRIVPGSTDSHHYQNRPHAPQHHYTDVSHSKDVEECTFEPNIRKSQRSVPGTNEKAKKYPVYERLHGSYAFVMDDIELPGENDLERENEFEHRRQEQQHQGVSYIEEGGEQKGEGSIAAEPVNITTAIKRRNRFNSLREDWMKQTQSLRGLEKDVDQLSEAASEATSINSYQSYGSRHSASSKKRSGRQYAAGKSRGGRGGRGGNRGDSRNGGRGGGGRGRSRIATRGEQFDKGGKMQSYNKNDNRKLAYNRQSNSISPTRDKSRAKGNLGLRQAKVQPATTRTTVGRGPSSSGEGLRQGRGRGLQERNSPTSSRGNRGKFKKSVQEGQQQQRDSERSSISTASRPQRRRWGDYSDSDD